MKHNSSIIYLIVISFHNFLQRIMFHISSLYNFCSSNSARSPFISSFEQLWRMDNFVPAKNTIIESLLAKNSRLEDPALAH